MKKIFEVERVVEQDNVAPVVALSESEYVLPAAYVAYENAYGTSGAVPAFESGREASLDGDGITAPGSTGGRRKRPKSGSASAPVSPTTKVISRSPSSPSSPAIRAAALAVAASKARQRGFLAAAQAATVAVSMARDHGGASGSHEHAVVEEAGGLAPAQPLGDGANGVLAAGDEMERDSGDAFRQTDAGAVRQLPERLALAGVVRDSGVGDIGTAGGNGMVDADAGVVVAGDVGGGGRGDGGDGDGGSGDGAAAITATSAATANTVGGGACATAESAVAPTSVTAPTTSAAASAAARQESFDNNMAVSTAGTTAVVTGTGAEVVAIVPSGTTLDQGAGLGIDINVTGSVAAAPTPVLSSSHSVASSTAKPRSRRKKQPQLPSSLFSGTSKPSTSYARLHLSHR